jgi:hypothetical protein
LVSWTLNHAPFPSVPEEVTNNKTVLQTLVSHPHLFAIVTPLKPQTFQSLLIRHPNRALVTSAVRVLNEGLWPWANVPADYPDTWDNSDRPLRDASQQTFVRTTIQTEVDAGRYSAPFGPALLAGMYSEPFSVVPKPHTDPPTWRQVFDYSAGRYSPNSVVSKEDAHIVLDSISHLAAVAGKKRAALPPGSRLVAWKSDVANAYRCIPVNKYWQVKQIVTFDGRRYFDRCNIWGHRPAGAAWCLFMAFILWIAQDLGLIEDPLAFVDDAFGVESDANLVLYEPYNRSMPSEQANLLRLWDRLGLPHKDAKQQHSYSLMVISFVFDPNTLTVKIPDESKAALLCGIREFFREYRVPLRRFQAGWIN